jgi:hypothetical protein
MNNFDIRKLDKKKTWDRHDGTSDSTIFSKGIHSIRFFTDFGGRVTKVRVESNFGKSSMVSDYSADERTKAVSVFKNLLENDILN